MRTTIQTVTSSGTRWHALHTIVRTRWVLNNVYTMGWSACHRVPAATTTQPATVHRWPGEAARSRSRLAFALFEAEAKARMLAGKKHPTAPVRQGYAKRAPTSDTGRLEAVMTNESEVIDSSPRPPLADDRAWGVEDVAYFLNVSDSLVRKLERERKLPPSPASGGG